MRYREGAEVRGREGSGMTIRFLERRTNYLFCCHFPRRETFWRYPAWEFSADTPGPSILGIILYLCVFSREKIHTSHLFLGGVNLARPTFQQQKVESDPGQALPTPTSFCKQGIWSSASFVRNHPSSGPWQSPRSPDSSQPGFSPLYGLTPGTGVQKFEQAMILTLLSWTNTRSLLLRGQFSELAASAPAMSVPSLWPA